jgi:hypothetical protein
LLCGSDSLRWLAADRSSCDSSDLVACRSAGRRLERAAKIQVRSDGWETVASVWGTTYLYQDLSRAKGWVQRMGDSYVLCFYAPEDVYGPGEGIPSGAFPTHFTYRIVGLPPQARLEFREKCALGANN